MFDRTQNNLKETCGIMYSKMEKSLKMLRRIYFVEIIALLIMGGAIGVFMSIYAAPNKSFVYQGRITGSDYLPLDDGTYYMRIKLHTAATGDVCAWSTGADTAGANCAVANATASIPVVLTRSLFSLPMGDTSYNANMPNIAALDFKNTTYFLEVSFATTQNGTYETFTTRTKLGSAASAVTVLDALQANTFNVVPATPTQLNGALTDSATTITVDSTTGYPSAGMLMIENEVVTYTATTATTFTGVTRGRFATTAAAHNDNTEVKTYLFSGAANATTRPTFFITSDGNTFINSNASTVNPQIGFQVSGTTNYALGIDRASNNNILKLGTTSPTTSTLLAIDARSTFASGGTFSAFTFTGLNNTLTTAAASDDYTTLTVTPPTTTLAGSTDLSAMNAILFNRPTIAAASRTVTDASTLAIAGPPSRSSGTITNSYGLKINTAAAGTTTNSYGLAVAAPTGATNNYSAIFTGGNVGVGTTAPITQMHVSGNVPSGALRTTTTAAGPLWIAVQGRYAYITNNTANTLEIYDISNPGTSFTGTGTLSSSGTTVTGSGTAFTSQLAVGDTITASGQSKTVTAIASATSLTTDTAFSPVIAGGTAFTFVEGKRVSTIATGTNPVQVIAQGKYAYVTNQGSDTLQIFDISNPASPTSMGTAATQDAPAGIAVQGRYAYILNSTQNTLQVFDVSNPASPSAVGNVATNTNPVGIFIQGRYVFITNSTSNTLQIADISNPASPTIVSSTAAGTTTIGVAVQGRYAYITNRGADTLQIFDVRNPASPSSVSTIATGDEPSGVAVEGRYAYVVNRASNTLQTFDISNPASPSSVGTVATGTLPIMTVVQGRYVFVPNMTSGTFQIFDVGGGYIQQLETGGLEAASGQVRSNFVVNNNLDVRGGATIGIGGLFSNGPLTAMGLSSAAGSAFDVRSSAGTSLFYVGNDGRVGIAGSAPAAGTGTVSSSGATVTGSGTSFTKQLSVGTTLIIGDQSRKVTAIASDTSLTTNTAFSPVIGAGTAFTFTYDLAFEGSTTRYIGVESAAADTAGSGLLIHGGSSGTGTDIAGGNLTLQSGNSTGTGQSKVIIQVPQKGSTGTSVNAVATMFEFVNGHIASVAMGSAPTSSGTACNAPDSGSNDISGKISLSGATATACTLTFAKAYTNTPTCTAIYEDLDNGGSVSIRTTAISTTAATFTLNGTPSNGDKISYFCVGLGSQ